jgi:hypothetical protein
MKEDDDNIVDVQMFLVCDFSKFSVVDMRAAV